ncbi:hypothetical protein K353_02254 [Kitasatospora sp. SolWspMP-SS2h]|nr:hypothetical protein K353_02254 [Kitasatospora sp. SolWspMP-SS2h]
MTVGSRCVVALLRASRPVGQAPGNTPRGGARQSACFPHKREPHRTRVPSLGGARSEPYSERQRSPTVPVVPGRIATAAVPATGAWRSPAASPCVGPFQLKSFEPWPVKSLPLLPTAARTTAGQLSRIPAFRRSPISHVTPTPGLPTPPPSLPPNLQLDPVSASASPPATSHPVPTQTTRTARTSPTPLPQPLRTRSPRLRRPSVPPCPPPAPAGRVGQVGPDCSAAPPTAATPTLAPALPLGRTVPLSPPPTRTLLPVGRGAARSVGPLHVTPQETTPPDLRRTPSSDHDPVLRRTR